MLRFASVCLALVIGSSALAQNANLVLPPTPILKREAVVSGDVVRIGDLVENAGDATDIAIFRSPDPGQTGMVLASKVIDAIRPHGLLLLDTHGLLEVAVSRASRTIGANDIEARIARALAQQYGLGDTKNLLFSFDRELRDLHVEASALNELQIARLTYDPRSGRFDVSLELPGSAAARRLALRFIGTVVETVPVAVLTRPVGRGEVVKPSDVVIERRPKSENGADVVGALSDIVGFAGRSALRAGQIVRIRDLMKPEIVQRNEQITLVYEAPGMVLTIRGKALESGAEGDVISVLNMQSKRTVQGVVSGPNRVTVTGATNRTASVVPPAVRLGQFAGE